MEEYFFQFFLTRSFQKHNNYTFDSVFTDKYAYISMWIDSVDFIPKIPGNSAKKLPLVTKISIPGGNIGNFPVVELGNFDAKFTRYLELLSEMCALGTYVVSRSKY